MKTDRQCTQTLLVLVPHRDVRLVLRKYSASLFKAGLSGAYFFPWVAPLAALSRPLNADELKYCARAIREASLAIGDGKISAVETDITAFSGYALFGPRLGLSLSVDVFTEVQRTRRTFGSRKTRDLRMVPFSPLVIGACLLPSAGYDKASLPPAPQVSFRAAAVANMIWRPSGEFQSGGGSFGCKWKIGKLSWLAPVRKRA